MQKTTVVIPCHNEEKRLDSEAFCEFVRENPGISFCFVDDGSADGTRAVLTALCGRCEGRAKVVDLPRNAGKAHAVRRGILEALADPSIELVGYLDADLATPLSEIILLAEALVGKKGCQMVLGSRVRRLGSCVCRKAKRHYAGRLFATVVSILLKLPVYDTQCGAKLFRAQLAKRVFADPFRCRWLFDVEILARILQYFGRKEALQMLQEVPLRAWSDKGGSTLTLPYVLRVPLDLLRIMVHVRMKGI